MKGRIGLQALNSQCDACVHFAGSQGSASALCTAAVSAGVYSISSYSLQRDSGFYQINCQHLPSENSEAGHEALIFKAYGQEFPLYIDGLLLNSGAVQQEGILSLTGLQNAGYHFITEVLSILCSSLLYALLKSILISPVLRF